MPSLQQHPGVLLALGDAQGEAGGQEGRAEVLAPSQQTCCTAEAAGPALPAGLGPGAHAARAGCAPGPALVQSQRRAVECLEFHRAARPSLPTEKEGT